jgi:uncharacterized membrane protein
MHTSNSSIVSADAACSGDVKAGDPPTVAGLSERRIELCPLNRLRPYKNNARTHSKKQIRQIANSIKRFGFTNPVLIDDAGEIIAGHGRVEAAKLIGLAAVPTIRLSHLTETEKRAYILADNRLAEKAGWDREILAIELQGLIELNFDVEITGFSTADIDITLDARPSGPSRLVRMRVALIEPLKEVYGVSEKVLMMALSQMMIGASDGQKYWFQVGGSMIAVDTLVHNFLHRTGILHRLEAVAHRVDARRFNRAFPKTGSPSEDCQAGGCNMSDLVFIAFDSEQKAEEVREKVLAMQKEYLIELGDAVVAVKDSNGRIKLNQLINTTAAGALSGAFWGTLIGLILLNPLLGMGIGAASGALGGKLTDVGINDDFTDKVLADLKGVGGTVMRTSFDETKEAALREALAGHAAAEAKPAVPT